MSNIVFNSTDQRPYTYSRRWRTKYNNRRHVTGICYRKAATSKLTYAMYFKAGNYVYDEYLEQFYVTNHATNPVIPLRAIPGVVISQEIGDSESDYLMEKVVVDMQHDTGRYNLYTYNNVSNADPKVILDTRSRIYSDDTPNLTQDLIDLNQTAMPSVNPFVSVRELPPVISPDDVNAPRESLALVTPLAKFRRCRFTFSTLGKVTTIRSVQVSFLEFPRRTWG